MNEEPEAVSIPIDGVLDLHTFSPRDAASVVEAYVWACVEKGLGEVRIIHGKGQGVLRRITQAALQRHPAVVDYRLDSGSSGWGATVAVLKPLGPCPRDD